MLINIHTLTSLFQIGKMILTGKQDIECPRALPVKNDEKTKKNRFKQDIKMDRPGLPFLVLLYKVQVELLYSLWRPR